MNNKRPTLKQIPVGIRRHLLQQQRGSLAIKAYCQKHDITAQTFYGWRMRYGKRLFTEVAKKSIASSEHNVSFATLGTLSTPLQKTVLFDICFPGGTSVTIYPGTKVEEFAPFLTLLSEGTRLC